MTNPSPDDNPWRAVALVSAIGVDLVVCMAVGYWIGRLAADRFGHPLWIVVGIMLGFAAGVFTVILLLRQFTGSSHE